MMNNPYEQDFDWTPDVVIEKRADNGHFTASANGRSVTHFDQAEAVNRLTAELYDAFRKGEITPGL